LTLAIIAIAYAGSMLVVQLIGMIRGGIEKMHDDHFKGKF